jgi:hypothetical protein
MLRFILYWGSVRVRKKSKLYLQKIIIHVVHGPYLPANNKPCCSNTILKSVTYVLFKIIIIIQNQRFL